LQTETVGRLTGQQRALLVEVGDRRGHHRLPAQAHHVQGCGGGDRRGGFRTDGTWIWTDTVVYYLERYALAPAP
jgi:hypothetical protein